MNKKIDFFFKLAGIFIIFSSQAAYCQTALPEGDNGIAAGYPEDVNIGNNPAVVYTDNFEGYSSFSGLSQNWEYLTHTSSLRIATEAGNIYSGSKALELTLPVLSSEYAVAVQKKINPKVDVLFLRHYAKIESTFDITGSSHNGAGIFANHRDGSGMAIAGVPANGTNLFLADMENWRENSSTANPGKINVYIYHPLQNGNYGDHFFPDGLAVGTNGPNYSVDFGSSFVSRPNTIQNLNQWYCYEFMLKANTPGLKDGRVAGWLNGKLVMDFGNLRLRDINTLKIDEFGIEMHCWSNPKTVRKWVDNVVLATSYIGPVYSSQPVTGGSTSQAEERILTYPNPVNFARSPTVKLDNISAGSTLKIYSVSGNLVTTLVSGTSSGRSFYDGGTTAYWDGTDDKSESVTNGIYYCIAVDNGGVKKRSKIAIIR